MPDKGLSEIVEKIVDAFLASPGLFLTEEDVRCHLVSLLLRVPAFSKPFIGADGEKSISIHSEVRWYGYSGKLKYRSDVVLLDPLGLRTKGGLKLPSKGYGFNDFWGIIEIKLRRANGKSDVQFKKEVENEITKLGEIYEETKHGNKHSPILLLLCLDKKGNIKNRIRHSLGSRIKFVYTSLPSAQ